MEGMAEYDFEDEDDPDYVPHTDFWARVDYWYRKLAGPDSARRNPLLRRRVLARDHGVCALCRLDTSAANAPWEADHIMALCEGGEDSLRNLRTLCLPCHKSETAALRRRRVR